VRGAGVVRFVTPGYYAHEYENDEYTDARYVMPWKVRVRLVLCSVVILCCSLFVMYRKETTDTMVMGTVGVVTGMALLVLALAPARDD
jgi:hypothetical protein